MSDRIRQALEQLAERHGIPTRAEPSRRNEPLPRNEPSRRNEPLPRNEPSPRRSLPDLASTGSRLATSDALRRRESAPPEARAMEGRYADVRLSGALVTVIILTVERTGFGLRATCKRLDTRQTVDRIRLDDLQAVRDDA